MLPPDLHLSQYKPGSFITYYIILTYPRNLYPHSNKHFYTLNLLFIPEILPVGREGKMPRKVHEFKDNQPSARRIPTTHSTCLEDTKKMLY